MAVVKVIVRDNDRRWNDKDFPGGILETYFLKDPDEKKLEELKHMIEHRTDYQDDDSLTDDQFEEAEAFEHDPWGTIEAFIEENFEKFDVEDFEISF